MSTKKEVEEKIKKNLVKEIEGIKLKKDIDNPLELDREEISFNIACDEIIKKLKE